MNMVLQDALLQLVWMTVGIALLVSWPDRQVGIRKGRMGVSGKGIYPFSGELSREGFDMVERGVVVVGS